MVSDLWLTKIPIAHRGLHNEKYPENSLAAFLNAADRGFAIELDVRGLDDGTVVVFHDEGLSRMTGTDGYLSNLKHEDIKGLKLLKSDQGIPLLSEVLAAISGRVPLLIEIKNTNKVGSLEQSIIKILDGYKGDVAVQSFNPYSMEYFKKNAPHILRGQLSSLYKNSDLSRAKKFFLKRLMMNKFSKPDFIAYDFTALPNRWVTRCGLPVLAWTVRSFADYDLVMEFCDNIIFEGFLPKAHLAR